MNGASIGRYLTFSLGGRAFAFDASRVEVVLEMVPITRVPKSPEYLRGLINYRGSVIPVADLSMRLGEGPTKAEHGSSIIVLHVRFGQDEPAIGVLADAVREVIDLDPSRIERPPEIWSKIEKTLIQGIAERDGEFIMIVEIDLALVPESASERETELM